jgi:hypothetical protein
MKELRAIGLGLLLALAPAAAGALSIGFAPVAVTGAVGSSLALDVVVSGLGDGTAPSLGSFDLDVSFDPSLLSFDSLGFGALLGGPADSLRDSDEPAAGVVDLAEVSLLSPPELDALQPDSFVLATLSFTALGAGTSTVSFSQALLGDAFGQRFGEVSLGAARVTASGAVIPEPRAFALFALGALAVARVRPRRS